MSTAEDTQATFVRVTGELAELAATAADAAERLPVNAKRTLHRALAKTERLRQRGRHDAAAGRGGGRLVRAVNDLTELLTAARKIVAQTLQRVAGITPELRGRSALLAWLDRLHTKGFWLVDDDVFGCDEHVWALSVMGARRDGIDTQTRVVIVFRYRDGRQV